MQTLSDNERGEIACATRFGAKAVQCIDERDARIAELESWYARAMCDVADLNKINNQLTYAHEQLKEKYARLKEKSDSDSLQLGWIKENRS